MEHDNALPDERPQRRREYSGAASTLGVALAVILAVGLGIWWFQIRDTGGSGSSGFGVVATTAAQNPTGQPPAAEAGRLAPNFHLPTLDGGALTLADFRGRYVLVNFWASWCGPCRGETPDLQVLSEQHAADLVVLGVNQQESPDAARSFAREFGLTYPMVLDRDGGVSVAYRVGRGLPVSLLLDRQGVVRHVYIGRLSQADLAAIAGEVGA